MAGKVRIKKGDTVKVLTGKDVGKKGKVLSVLPKDSRVFVEGINMATKHAKPRSRTQQGGLMHQEAPIDSSNVMLICNKCKSPTKVSKRIMEDGQKARFCKKCDEIIDVISEQDDA